MRPDGRKRDELRPLRFTLGVSRYADGSCLVEAGYTRVLCTAMAVDQVPPFLLNQKRGWVTAEYSMLPASSPQRKAREGRGGKVDGRMMEIQRFIGRSLRSVVHTGAMGERTLWLDCDVLQADGGTRTASICGAYLAMVQAFQRLQRKNMIAENPVRGQLAAVSVGKVQGAYFLDLSYEEDSVAEVDLNVVMTQTGKLVEVQGGGEGGTFSLEEMNQLISLAQQGLQSIFLLQNQALGA